MNIKEQIEWLEKEAQRHSQSASDNEFTSRRRATFKHRAKELRGAAKTMEKLLAVYEAIDGLLSESSGVDGYHLNGNIASWDELGIPELLAAVKSHDPH